MNNREQVPVAFVDNADLAEKQHGERRDLSIKIIAPSFSGNKDDVKYFAKAMWESGFDSAMDHYRSLAHLVSKLKLEVDCRVHHGANSNGHLEYVLSELNKWSGHHG